MANGWLTDTLILLPLGGAIFIALAPLPRLAAGLVANGIGRLYERRLDLRHRPARVTLLQQCGAAGNVGARHARTAELAPGAALPGR